jgi:segregation and condensation protein A
MAYQVRLSQFEGPLDLLLHLIRRDKIDIYDIPISHITHEYLSYIEIMQELELELAGEFFVMAATLMRIKAQMLLPRRSEDEDEEEDPRDELVRNLLEYKKYKEAAQHMAEMENDRRRVYTRPTATYAFDEEEQGTLEVTVFDLLGAFKKVFEELKKQVSYRISKDPVTIEEKIELITSKLESRSEVLFTELFEGDFTKMDIIVTFLAILELVRLGDLLARQMTKGQDIWLYRPAEKPHVEAEEGVHERNEQS